MSNGKRYHPATKERARQLRAKGMYYWQIAEKLGVSNWTVREWTKDVQIGSSEATSLTSSEVCPTCGQPIVSEAPSEVSLSGSEAEEFPSEAVIELANARKKEEQPVSEATEESESAVTHSSEASEAETSEGSEAEPKKKPYDPKKAAEDEEIDFEFMEGSGSS